MNYKKFLLRIIIFIYIYNFLSTWSAPPIEIIVIDPNAINRWIDKTNLQINIYYDEFMFLLKFVRLYLNLKNYN
jgi:hypothetical protein